MTRQYAKCVFHQLLIADAHLVFALRAQCLPQNIVDYTVPLLGLQCGYSNVGKN